MRIGINALYLLPGRVGGSEIYVRNLVKWLPKAGPENEYFVFVNRESEGVFEALSPEVKVVRCGVRAQNRALRILYEELVLPLKVLGLRLDATVSAGMTAPFVCPGKSLAVVYDLQHINQPQNFNRWYLLFLKTIIYLSAKSADGVLTLSERSKRDIIKFYKIRPGDITVTYLASDKGLFYKRNGSEVAAVREKYGLPERFILYIASALPHKNYERLLSAFKLVKERDESVKLVLIGARDYGQDAVVKKIEALGLKGEVVFLGWLPFEDIPLIYSAAELFCFPSLHEGFGIPVLEAMACGVPVVCSNIEPLDEVAGDAACLVNPLDERDMAEGMLKVLGDKGLREKLVRDGLERAEGFSWKKTALDTLAAVYARTGRKALCGLPG